jgi:tetratricopeptide (TPR) repeat protein
MMRIESGDIAVLGGLMEDVLDNRDGRLPGLGDIPFIGEVFNNRDNLSNKSELVVLVRPTVIHDTSIDGDFKNFRDTLPNREFFKSDQVYRPFSLPERHPVAAAMSLLMDALRRAEEAKRLAGPAGEVQRSRLLRSNSPSTRSNRRVPRAGHCRRTPGAPTRLAPRRHRKRARRRPDQASRCREIRRRIPAAAMPANAARRKTSLPPNRLPVRRADRCGSLWVWEASQHWQSAVISGGSCNRCPVVRSSDRPSRHCRQARPPHLWCRPFSARLPRCRRRRSRRQWSRRRRRPPSGHLPQRRVRGHRQESSPAFRVAAQSGVFRPGGGREKQQQALDLAYQAWQADRLDDARHSYEQVLHSDARNADALLGLAAIAARQGQPERAHDLYQQVLESDPTDVTAQAALINLRGPSDAGQSESRLKTLLAGQSDSAAAHVCAGQRLCPAGPLERGAAGLLSGLCAGTRQRRSPLQPGCQPGSPPSAQTGGAILPDGAECRRNAAWCLRQERCREAHS